MNFKTERKIEENVLSVQVSHATFGSETMTAEEEKKMFGHFGYPEIDAGGLFEGMFLLNPEGVIEENDLGSPIRILLNSKKVRVDEGFHAEFLVNIKKITESELSDNLPDRICVAEARCLLVETRIVARITDEILRMRALRAGFADGYPKETTI